MPTGKSRGPGNNPSQPTPVRLGIDRLLDDPLNTLRPHGGGTSVGLLTNDAARTGSTWKPTRLALLDAGVPLTRLFAPEHGLAASAPDGRAIPDSAGQATGLPVTSLYGGRLRPDVAALGGSDLVLVDLQDAGARFYTYLWTLTHMMEACSELGLPMVLLDRPNPLGGREEWVEGPLPDTDYPPTFLGRWPVPIRHSLTLGEMAGLLREEMGMDLRLHVIAMEGWRREMVSKDTALPFHPPSPGLPSPESVLLYPGLALLEATNVLEGRGTAFSFQWMGAPWMDAPAVAAALNRFDPAGVHAHARTVKVEGDHGSQPCPGVFLEVTDPREVRPVALGLRLLSLLPTLCREHFRWRAYPTASNPGGRDHLQRLLSCRQVTETLEQCPETVDDSTVNGWTRARGWWDRVKPHLIYD